MNIAIIEDDKEAQERLVSYIDVISKEKSISCQCSLFADLILFLTDYKPIYDVIFLDIDLPHMNGLDGAFEIRKRSPGSVQ